MSTRRSTRLAEAQTSLKPTKYQEEQSDVEEEVVVSKPRKKRARVQDGDDDAPAPRPRAKRIKGKAKLGMLPSMPLDVLFAVSQYIPGCS
jgi:hypothetical protein